MPQFFEVSCYSDCGSYFGAYLKRLIVAANSSEEAIVLAKAWQERAGEYFIKPSQEWHIDSLTPDCGVILADIDSDY